MTAMPESVRQAHSHELPTPTIVTSTGSNDDTLGDPRVRLAASISLVANVSLLCVNVAVAALTGSLAIFASAVDSFLDIASEFVVVMASRANRNVDKTVWPVGRSRLEPLGVVVVASMMAVASLLVFVQSLIRLGNNASLLLNNENNINILQRPSVNNVMLGLFVVAIATKALLYLYCVRLRHVSSICAVLAEDHRNDVLSNSVAITAAMLASTYPQAWSVDPVGGILISAYIFMRWAKVGHEQSGLLVGRAAQPELIDRVTRIASMYSDRMTVDVVRAYHFGPRYFVEVEVVMPVGSTLDLVHDESLGLQKRIEQLEEVERAHVHVDYEFRHDEEHKIVGSFRTLNPQAADSAPSSPLATVIGEGSSEVRRRLPVDGSAVTASAAAGGVV